MTNQFGVPLAFADAEIDVEGLTFDWYNATMERSFKEIIEASLNLLNMEFKNDKLGNALKYIDSKIEIMSDGAQFEAIEFLGEEYDFSDVFFRKEIPKRATRNSIQRELSNISQTEMRRRRQQSQFVAFNIESIRLNSKKNDIVLTLAESNIRLEVVRNISAEYVKLLSEAKILRPDAIQNIMTKIKTDIAFQIGKIFEILDSVPIAKKTKEKIRRTLEALRGKKIEELFKLFRNSDFLTFIVEINSIVDKAEIKISKTLKEHLNNNVVETVNLLAIVPPILKFVHQWSFDLIQYAKADRTNDEESSEVPFEFIDLNYRIIDDILDTIIIGIIRNLGEIYQDIATVKKIKDRDIQLLISEYEKIDLIDTANEKIQIALDAFYLMKKKFFSTLLYFAQKIKQKLSSSLSMEKIHNLLYRIMGNIRKYNDWSRIPARGRKLVKHCFYIAGIIVVAVSTFAATNLAIFGSSLLSAPKLADQIQRQFDLLGIPTDTIQSIIVEGTFVQSKSIFEIDLLPEWKEIARIQAESVANNMKMVGSRRLRIVTHLLEDYPEIKLVNPDDELDEWQLQMNWNEVSESDQSLLHIVKHCLEKILINGSQYFSTRMVAIGEDIFLVAVSQSGARYIFGAAEFDSTNAFAKIAKTWVLSGAEYGVAVCERMPMPWYDKPDEYARRMKWIGFEILDCCERSGEKLEGFCFHRLAEILEIVQKYDIVQADDESE